MNKYMIYIILWWCDIDKVMDVIGMTTKGMTWQSGIQRCSKMQINADLRTWRRCWRGSLVRKDVVELCLVQDGILQLLRVKWSNRARCHSAELEAQSRDWIAPKLSWRQCYRERVALTSAEAAMLRNHDISCQNYPSPKVFSADGHGGVLHSLNPLDHPHAPQILCGTVEFFVGKAHFVWSWQWRRCGCRSD